MTKNFPVVTNLSNLFGGHDVLLELEAVRIDNGSWRVKCVPVLRPKEFKLLNLFKGWFGKGNVEGEVFVEVIPGNCRVESDGGEDSRRAVIYFPASPSEYKRWFLSSHNGVMGQVAHEIGNRMEQFVRIAKMHDVSYETMLKWTASGGSHDYFANVQSETYKKVIGAMLETKKKDEELNKKE